MFESHYGNFPDDEKVQTGSSDINHNQINERLHAIISINPVNHQHPGTIDTCINRSFDTNQIRCDISVQERSLHRAAIRDSRTSLACFSYRKTQNNTKNVDKREYFVRGWSFSQKRFQIYFLENQFLFSFGNNTVTIPSNHHFGYLGTDTIKCHIKVKCYGNQINR